MGFREESKTISTAVKFCDRCGRTDNFSYGAGGRCPACGRDVCGLCCTPDPDDPGDYPEVWCNECWKVGQPFRLRIEAECQRHEQACDAIREEWYGLCKQQEADKVATPGKD